MNVWPDRTIAELLGIEVPIIQAPMAGVDTPALAAAVTGAGGLGSLACALLSPDGIRAAWAAMRRDTDGPVNLNFFCHEQGARTDAAQARWRDRLAPYYAALGLDIERVAETPTRAPFDDAFCAVVEELRPAVVSFHFGLPAEGLMRRVKAAGAVVLSSATTAEEAAWLERRGCDAVIAQGVEAGGHRGMFLTGDVSTQADTLSLVSQIRRITSLPVIAAGGIADACGIKACLEAGAGAVQLGTAYMFCPEAKVSPLYRAALATDAPTVLTNVFSGRPARGIVNRFIEEVGPMAPDAPAFPYASHYVAPLRAASEKAGCTDFMQMWAGTVRREHALGAGALTVKLGGETLALMAGRA